MSSGEPVSDLLHDASAADAFAEPTTVEALLRMWGRRAVTIPLYVLLWAGALCFLPVLGVAAAVADVARGRTWVLVRCLAFFVVYLTCEVVGIVCSFVVWVASGVWVGVGHERFARWNFGLESWWARTLFWGAEQAFGIQLVIDERCELRRGPFVVFIRHASVGDTLLPAVCISSRYGIRLRYVLKRHLLWDPCLDIVGNRLPNYFVDRSAHDTRREVAGVAQLGVGMGPADGVLIYPEGTRFTPAKQERALRRLAESGRSDLLAIAQTLHHVLPPRLGGALALLDQSRTADAVFCAHVGFEGTESFWELLDGALVGRVVRVCFWRVPAAEIPRDRVAQSRWLFEQWRQVDEWIEAQRGA